MQDAVFYQGGRQVGFIVGDGFGIAESFGSVAKLVWLLLATYYLFDLQYQIVYGQVLGILQTVVMQQEYGGQKTCGYKQLLSSIQQEMKTLQKTD